MKDLKRRALSTMLAGSLIFGSGALTTSAEAFNSKKPTTTIEEFNNYKGVKIFINGRLVEFNNDLGYPFIENGRTMIPLRAVAETFHANVSYDSYFRKATVARQNKYVQVFIDSNKVKYHDVKFNDETIYTDVNAVIRNNRTYIPLRAVFELFGLNVRWDDSTKTAHIETNYDNISKNIVFRGKNLISINQLGTSSVNKVIYDDFEITKDYVNILKNSNQYKVYVENGVAYIYSYQYLNDLSFLYDYEKITYDLIGKEEYKKMNFISEEEMGFFSSMCDMLSADPTFNLLERENNTIGKYYEVDRVVDGEEYFRAKAEAKVIANTVKSQTGDVEEQIKITSDILRSRIAYDYDGMTSYETLVLGSGNCSGFQAAFELVMDELKIPCINMVGTLKGSGHMWGLVYVNGKWQNVDVTNNVILFDSDFISKMGYKLDEEYKEPLRLLQLNYKFY